MARPKNPELKETILDTAESLISAKGLNSLTMRGLARKIGITPTTIYYYFESKESLFEALKFRILDQLDLHIRERMDTSASWSAQLFQLMEVFLRWMVREQHRTALVFETLPPKTDLTEAEFRRYYKVQLYAEELLKKAALAGEIRDCDPEVESNVWLSLLYGTAKLWTEKRLTPRFWDSIDPLIERIRELYVKTFIQGEQSP